MTENEINRVIIEALEEIYKAPVFDQCGICGNLEHLLYVKLKISNLFFINPKLRLNTAFRELGYISFFPIGENEILKIADFVRYEGQNTYDKHKKDGLWKGRQKELRLQLIKELIEYFKNGKTN